VSDLEGMISGILSDPDQMKKIMDMAGQIMGSSGNDSSTIPASGVVEAAPALDNILSGLNDKSGGLSETLQNILGGANTQNSFGALNTNAAKDNKQALVDALKPWLSEKRIRKLDRAMMFAKMFRAAGAASLFKRGG